MKVTVTGATGLVGRSLVAALKARGDDVTVLARDPEAARASLGDVEAHAWDALAGPAPAAALQGRGGVVHLAGAPVAQRWTARARREIRDSREAGTRSLVDGLREAQPRPGVLVSSSAVGIYGDRGDERLAEGAAPADGFLADVCRAWEAEAERAAEIGLRVVRMRTGVVLDADGGALAKMLPPFKLGVGGPVAGGRQYLPWIHRDDLVAMMLAALDDARWEGPVNAAAPEPVTNAEFSKALGRVLRRPSFAPVPALAIRALYGDMAEIVTGSQRAVPARARELGFEWRFVDLEPALRDALGR